MDNEEKAVTLGIAALFRCFGMLVNTTIKNPDLLVTDKECIGRAREFVAAAKASGIWPDKGPE